MDHAVSEACFNLFAEFDIPGLRDLMVAPDKTLQLPVSRTTNVSTWLRPAPSFQRACERRALYYLDSPQLTSLAGPSPGPSVSVTASFDGVGFDNPVVTVLTNSAGPVFDEPGPIHVIALDSDDIELHSANKPDVRLQALESGSTVATAIGQRTAFSAPIAPGLRRVRVTATAPAMATRTLFPLAPTLPLETVLLDVDLGPQLVAACAAHNLPAMLCETFDSDGDGCRDVVDSDPLAPEQEPPTITGTVSPQQLWPPNHKFQTVTATIDVHDNCTANPTLVLDSIDSSEPESVVPGDKAPDIQNAAIGSADTIVDLRAERYNGTRRYTLHYVATDRAGNSSRLDLVVEVPHSQGQQ